MSVTHDDLEPVLVDEPLARPLVAGERRRGRAIWGYGATLLAGGAVLFAMTTARQKPADSALISPASAATAHFVTPESLPSDMAAGSATRPDGAPAIPAPQFSADNSVPATPTGPVMPETNAPTPSPTPDAVSRQDVPAMVVDLSTEPTTAVTKGDAAPTNPALATPAKSAGGVSDDSQFLQSVSGAAESAHATRIGQMNATIAEGTVISATLETGINSDLPGFARAVIARNVMSFDGTRMLIPRGSRVIGQYKSGVAMGGSRVFVIWTRLIRPDGVSIQLASPSSDDLGRGGLAGKVNRHFFQRFGGSILTSVLNGAMNVGVAAVGGGSPVYIDSVSQAGAAASSASTSTGSSIAPTVKTPQGAAVKIFVAHDLDFSGYDTAP